MIGQMYQAVHFVEYDMALETSYCRAALITGIYESSDDVDLVIVSQHNLFITSRCPYDGDKERNGSWHYAEK